MLEIILAYFEVFGYFFVLLAVIFSMITSAMVNSTFRRYSSQMSRRGLSGAQAAEEVLRKNGVTGVQVSRTSGHLTDHFNPKDNTIYLSDSVYSATSTAAIGVAAHEAGHAVQHAKGYVPIRIRSAIVPVTNLGSKLSMPLIMIGLLFMYLSESAALGYQIAIIGVVCFSLCVVFQLVTLPTEFNASRRAMEALDATGVLSGEELKGARKTLTAAAMTYVAALAVSLTQLLRLLAMVMGGRSRRR